MVLVGCECISLRRQLAITAVSVQRVSSLSFFGFCFFLSGALFPSHFSSGIYSFSSFHLTFFSANLDIPAIFCSVFSSVESLTAGIILHCQQLSLPLFSSFPLFSPFIVYNQQGRNPSALLVRLLSLSMPYSYFNLASAPPSL